jgi:hypothetical protein
MTWSKVYPFSATNNGEVNVEVLEQQIKDSAIDTGVNPIEQVASNTATQAILIEFTDPLSAPDELILDGVVAAHDGEPFAPKVLRVESLTKDDTQSDTPQTKVSGTVPLPLPAGDYQITWACEIRMQAAVPNAGVRALLLINGTEVYQDNWDLDQWHTFSGAGSTKFKAGDKPTVALEYERIGVVATVEIRRARLALILEAEQE